MELHDSPSRLHSDVNIIYERILTADGVALTCYHVIDGVGTVRIIVNGKWARAEVLATDPGTDSALLKVAADADPLAIADSDSAQVGQDVFTVGFPNADVQGLTPKYNKGEISAIAGARDDARYFQVSVPTQSGNSGGPLLTATGSVIGVLGKQLDTKKMLAAGRSAPQNVNYALKTNELVALLAKVPGLEKKLIRPVAGARKPRKEEVIRKAETATVLVMGYEN